MLNGNNCTVVQGKKVFPQVKEFHNCIQEAMETLLCGANKPKNPKNLENACLRPAKPAPPVHCLLQAQAARAMPQSEKPAHARLNV